MIGIIEYGSGNVGAIANIYKSLKVPHVVSGDPDVLRDVERYVLPGVGAFDTTMRHLNESGILEVLNAEVRGAGKKVLGICVGMQILADSSEEGQLPGLGWVPGRVRKIDASMFHGGPRLPHMGWNSIDVIQPSPLLEGVDLQRGFYFLHSYFFEADRGDSVFATVNYGKNLPCGVRLGNVFGMQFHPEKSHSNGVAVFRNFADF